MQYFLWFFQLWEGVWGFSKTTQKHACESFIWKIFCFHFYQFRFLIRSNQVTVSSRLQVIAELEKMMIKNLISFVFIFMDSLKSKKQPTLFRNVLIFSLKCNNPRKLSAPNYEAKRKTTIRLAVDKISCEIYVRFMRSRSCINRYLIKLKLQSWAIQHLISVSSTMNHNFFSCLFDYYDYIYYFCSSILEVELTNSR